MRAYVLYGAMFLLQLNQELPVAVRQRTTNDLTIHFEFTDETITSADATVQSSCRFDRLLMSYGSECKHYDSEGARTYQAVQTEMRRRAHILQLCER